MAGFIYEAILLHPIPGSIMAAALAQPYYGIMLSGRMETTGTANTIARDFIRAASATFPISAAMVIKDPLQEADLAGVDIVQAVNSPGLPANTYLITMKNIHDK